MAMLFRFLLIALSLLLLDGGQAMAQFPANNRPGSNSGPPSDAGDLYGGPGSFAQDSLQTDSSSTLGSIPPDTRYVDRLALFTHRDHLLPVGQTLENSMIFDPLEAVPGFVQNLGQIGKPYQAWLQGLEEKYQPLPLWQDPVFRRYDRYSLDPAQQVRFYDTKTPYIDVQFTQGPRKLQVVDVSLSRNFGPSLNISGRLRRPQSVGAYRNNVTDHTLGYLAAYYRSPKERYHAFASTTFNRQNDQLNGGVARAVNDNLYPRVDGLIQDNLAQYNLTFFKENFSPFFDAFLFRKGTSLHLDQYYHLFGQSDSSGKKHRLTLQARVQADWLSRRYADTGIDTTKLKTNLIPVLPTLAARTNAVEDSFSVRRWEALGGVSYSWLMASGWQANATGSLSYQRIAVARDSFALSQNITEQMGRLELRFPGGALSGSLRQRVSDQFQTEQQLLAGLDLGLPVRRDSLLQPGTTDAPLQFHASLQAANLNPSLFQARLPGGTGNAYQPNDSLRNEQLLALQASLSYRSGVPIRDGDTLLPHFASLHASWSSRQRPILYTESFEVIQPDESLSRLSLEMKGRLRMSPHFYLENHTEYLPRLFRSANPTLDLYLRSLPELRGKTSIYFDHRDLKIAREFRLGLAMTWWTSYAGQTVEPISGEFFPTAYQVQPFASGEAFFQLNLHGVFVYFRYLYLNENLLFNGYYTTPFHPMLERTYVLGVNWTFYD